MRSVKSYFNTTLFVKNLTRFWPIWGLYTAFCLFILPVPLITRDSASLAEPLFTQRLPLDVLAGAGLPFMALFGLLSAMAVFSYLYNSSSVVLIHSLPIRREGLFLTNYLSGLLFIWVPSLLTFFLSLGIEAAHGNMVFPSLFLWLVGTCLLYLFFYSFAVFCAMVAGHLLALPAFYVILIWLLFWMNLFPDYLGQELLYGYSSSFLEDLSPLLLWLFPYYKLSSSLHVFFDEANQIYQFTGLRYIFLYALIALVLTVLALIVYHHRQLETAGDVVAVRWARPLFQWGMALCFTLALGCIFHLLLKPLFSSKWAILGCMLAAGALGWFLSEMLLHKSFRIFRRGWKGCTALLVCVVLAFSALKLDVFGFVYRVPDQNEIQSISIHANNTSPSDNSAWAGITILDTEPEIMAQALDFHQSLLNDVRANDGVPPEVPSSVKEQDGLMVEVSKNQYLTISYNLKNGTTLSRNYHIPVTAEALAQPDSTCAQLLTLLNLPVLVERAYFSDITEDFRLNYAEVVNSSGDAILLQVSPALLDAVRADLREGNLGRHSLLEDRQRFVGNYTCSLTLHFSVPQGNAANQHTPAAAGETSVLIGLQPSAVHTLAALRQSAGSTDGLVFTTLAEWTQQTTTQAH